MVSFRSILEDECKDNKGLWMRVHYLGTDCICTVPTGVQHLSDTYISSKQLSKPPGLKVKMILNTIPCSCREIHECTLVTHTYARTLTHTHTPLHSTMHICMHVPTNSHGIARPLSLSEREWFLMRQVFFLWWKKIHCIPHWSCNVKSWLKLGQ